MAPDGISVAMATFNGEPFLAAQLASLAAQSVKPLELLVCDDRSTDGTPGVLEAFARQAPFPVRLYVNDENLGCSANFIKAASLCDGSIIAFCDQDDVWHPDKVRRVGEFFAASDALTVTHDCRVVYEDGRAPIASYFDFMRLSGFPPAYNVKGCTLAFRVQLIARFGWPDRRLKMSHDVWVCLTAALLGKRAYLNQSLIDYRIHGGNSSGLVIGGDKRLARLLRGLALPPFTSHEDRDVTLGYFLSELLPASTADLLREMVDSPGAAFTDAEQRGALSALRRTLAIRRFVTGESYARPARRTLKALRLFLAGAYRNGDGMQGVLLDILGRRS